MRTLAVMNQKGGSGKSTTALCIGYGLATRSTRTLFVDADAQANSSATLLDGAPIAGPTLGHVLLGRSDVTAAIHSTRIPGLDVIPADAQLADAALLLADSIGREHRLRTALRALVGQYDVVVVDTGPSMNLVNVNVLAAAGEVWVPVDAGQYSVMGLGRLQQTVDEVRRYLDAPTLHVARLVLTRAMNNRVTRDIGAQLREAFPGLVADAVIPHSVRVEEAHARNRTILEWAPDSPPARAYLQLIEEVIRYGQPEPRSADDRRGADPAEQPRTRRRRNAG